MSRNKTVRRWNPIVFCADSLLLSLLLAAVGLCCQSVYGLGDGRRLLALTAVGAGLLLAVIHCLPKFRWAALLLVAEGYALFAWLMWERLILGGAAAAACLGLALGGGETLPDPFPAED